MWPFRKSKFKNRRLGRRTVLLDVKMRSSQVRAMRMRWGGIALGVSFGTVFGLYIAWRCCEWGLNHFLFENKEFAVQQVDVQTDGDIAQDQLRRWAGIRKGENLFALDLRRVKRDLELVPAVKSAAVERVLPRTVRLTVTEREPVAQAYAPQLRADGRGYDMQLFHIDSEGSVMLPLESRQRANPAQPVAQLPTIAGFDPSGLKPGGKLDSKQVRAALDLIVAFDRSPMAGFADIRRIDVSSTSVLQAQTGQGSTIVFAPSDFDRQLRRWRAVYDGKIRANQVIAWMDLSVDHNTPLRAQDVSTVAPFTPAPKTKPANPKKRNV